MKHGQDGFLLLSTIVLLALMSALALLMINSASMDSARAASDAETANAAYAAEAGLAHARWALRQNGSCSGYAGVPDTAFGAGGYRAAISATSGSPVTVTATGWLDDGSTVTRTETDVVMYSSAGTGSLTLQPGPEGVDTYIQAGASADNNYGAISIMSIANIGAERMALLRFDLSALPAGVQVTDAWLDLYLTAVGSISNGTIDVHRPIRTWFEGEMFGSDPTSPGATYNRYDGTSLLASWSLLGVQYDATVLSSLTIPTLTSDWQRWDVSALVDNGRDSMIANEGVLLRASAGAVDRIEILSSDGWVGQAPKLTVEYFCACGSDCAGATPATEPFMLSTMGDAEIGGLSFKKNDLVDYDPVADTATLALDALALGLGARIDALHMLDNGHYVISTHANATLGGLNFSNADLIDYDPINETATMFLEAQTHFQNAKNVTSVHVLDNGHIVLSTDRAARLGNVDFSERDLIQYDRTTRTATVLFDGDATTLSKKITALHIFASGRLVLTADGDTSLGGLAFGADQLVEYDPVAATATLYFDGETRFGSPAEKFEALHIGAGSGSGAGPIAHWKLDETGGLTAVDAAGGNDGTLSGTTSWTTGEIDNALDFGTGVVTVPHNDALSLTSLMTISAWFNADSLALGYRAIVSKEASPDTNNYWFGLVNNELAFGFWGGSGWDLVRTTGLPVATGNWYHAAATFDAATGQVVLYHDGVVVFDGTITATPQASVSPIRLGNSSQNEAWRGALDDVRIYDVALGAADVAELAGVPPGGGGGGGCTATLADDFDAATYANSDGTLSWSDDWLEINEGDGATGGDIRVDNADSDFHLRLQKNDGGGEGVQREADLSSFSSATLSFDYRRQGLDDATDYVTVDVSGDGGANWIELDRFAGNATDSTYQPASYDISAFLSNDTRIRFLTSPNLGGTDRVYVDNVQIVACP